MDNSETNPPATPPLAPGTRRTTAFVLGGGGDLGSSEVGMLRALIERGIVPDLVVGSSVGAINGAAIAAQPTMEMVERLEAAWGRLGRERTFDSPLRAAGTLLRERSHLHSNAVLRQLIQRLLPASTFEELALPFQCVAASIERAAEHWFTTGPLLDAILASSAVPGLLQVVELGGEHFMDGGIVNSIPVGRACELGAREVYVLQVGRIEQALAPPRNLYQALTVAFEVARRYRFAHDMANLPPGTLAHVLPTGDGLAVSSGLRSWGFGKVADRIRQAYAATSAYLDGLGRATP